jgi:CheY-like chemotaxis protein
MDQVLMNLAVNARDAMPSGGVLAIGCVNRTVSADDAVGLWGPEPVPAGDYVVVTVSDTGGGMSPETLSRAFEPFFTTKPLGKGTGLGLATVYGIVRQSGGYLAVEAEPGRGTVFSIFLPRHHASLDAAPQPAPAGAGGAETVLLAEDEDSVRQLVRRVLQAQGYHVLAAASGAEALRLADEHDGPIPLLLTDVMMSGMSGPELAGTITARRAELRVLFMSGLRGRPPGARPGRRPHPQAVRAGRSPPPDSRRARPRGVRAGHGRGSNHLDGLLTPAIPRRSPPAAPPAWRGGPRRRR